MENRNKKIIIYLLAVITVGALLRLLLLSANGLNGDAALYSVRAVGWLDFLVGQDQTSPIVWFNSIPWWANLSFHDVPPLGIFIQYLFFSIFGDNVLAALLPFALAGIGSLGIIYLVGKKVGQNIGLLAAMLLCFSSYAVWISRTGYLEGLLVLTILCSIFMLASYIQTKKGRYILLWGLFVGLSLATKYTALFLLPAAVLYFIIWQRSIFKDKHFWLSLTLALVVLSPVIIYNIMVWKTRGHFDAALSSMLGMHPADFNSISSRGVNLNIFSNFAGIFKYLAGSISIPMSILSAVSTIFLVVKMFRKKTSWLTNLLLINLLTIFAMFTFAGSEARFLPIALPFTVLLTAIFINHLWQTCLTHKKIILYALCGVLIFEFFYLLNTNIFTKPVGVQGVLYSKYRFYDLGFNDLEKYLEINFYFQDRPIRDIKTFDDILGFELIKQKAVILDERLDWFNRVWYLNRQILYRQEPLMGTNDILYWLEQENLQESDIVSYLSALGINEIYFIYVSPAGRLAPKDPAYNERMENFKNQLEQSSIYPDAEIKNYSEQTVFKIYHFFIN